MARAQRNGGRHIHLDIDEDVPRTAFEKLRANVPLWRTLGTMVSILLSALWITWQGSMWVTRLETRLAAIEQLAQKKADTSEIEHRFALMCARAPAREKPWVCGVK